MNFEINVFVPAKDEPLFEAVAYDGNDQYVYHRKFNDGKDAAKFLKEVEAAVKNGSFLDTDSWIKFSH
jgi:hypothetical protein